MTNPTPEQIEARTAALAAWQEGSTIRQYSEYYTSFEDGYDAALVAAAGVIPQESEVDAVKSAIYAGVGGLVGSCIPAYKAEQAAREVLKVLRISILATSVQVDEAKLVDAIAEELNTDGWIAEEWSNGKLNATARRLVDFAVMPVLRGGGQ